MRYTSSQSYHTKLHWQSNKRGTMTYIAPSLPISGIIKNNKEYRFPYSLKSNYSEEDILSIIQYSTPIFNAEMNGNYLAVFNPFTNLTYENNGLKLGGSDVAWSATETKTYYKYIDGFFGASWSEVNSSTSVINHEANSIPTSELGNIAIPIVKSYPVLWHDNFNAPSSPITQDGFTYLSNIEHKDTSYIGIFGYFLRSINIEDNILTEPEYFVCKYSNDTLGSAYEKYLSSYNYRGEWNYNTYGRYNSWYLNSNNDNFIDEQCQNLGFITRNKDTGNLIDSNNIDDWGSSITLYNDASDFRYGILNRIIGWNFYDNVELL